MTNLRTYFRYNQTVFLRSGSTIDENDWRRSYEKTHIIFLAEAEEAADLGSPLGTEALWVDGIGEAGDVVVALLDDAESEDGEVHGDDAATDALPLALAGAAGAVAGVALGKEEGDTSRVHDTLLHRETLLVVATGDAEDVALEPAMCKYEVGRKSKDIAYSSPTLSPGTS